MELVEQLTPYTCVLACLESFFKDIKFDADQCGILRHPELRKFCLNPNPKERHTFGSMNDIQLILLANRLGFNCIPFKIDDRENLEKCWSSLKPEQAVLIFAVWNGDQHHCVRFCEIIDEGKYRIMNPAFLAPQFETITFQELLDKDYRFHLLTKK